MKRKRNRGVSQLGVDRVSSIVHAADCLFHKIDQEDDVGNDAFIEFISPEETEGFCIGAQVKSGKSYFTSSGSPRIPGSKRHFQYWKSLNLPVAGFAFDPGRDTVFWVDITQYLRSDPKICDEGPYSIPVPDTNILSPGTFHEFREHFQMYHSEMSSAKSLIDSISRLINHRSFGDFHIALRFLFAYHRSNIVAWFAIMNMLRSVSGRDYVDVLIGALEYIPGHPDIFWHSGNIIPEETRKAVHDLLSTHWGETEIRLLIKSIDPNQGVDRGTLGQAIYVLTDTVKDARMIYRKIAFDHNTDSLSSYFALLFYLDGIQRYAPQEKVIALIDDYIAEFPRNEMISSLEELRLVILEYGFFSFY